MKHIFLAPDSFKGSLSSNEIIKIVSEELILNNKNLHIESSPLCDGGEGTLKILTEALSGTFKMFQVEGPLGRMVNANVGFLGNASAIIELAEASGIERLNSQELNPYLASTFGTGELIYEVIKLGYKKITLTLGGSATVDGGTGIVLALGGVFYDQDGRELKQKDSPLFKFHSCDLTEFKNIIKDVEFTIVVDVNNPLLGVNGAAMVFGPQKGVVPDKILEFESKLAYWGYFLEEQYKRSIMDIKGSGAAGGAMLPFLINSSTSIVSGFSMADKLLEYRKKIKNCDYLITGEGRIDDQSFMGKGIGTMIDLAFESQKKVIVIAGENKLKDDKYLTQIDQVYSLLDKSASQVDAIKNATRYLKIISQQIAQSL